MINQLFKNKLKKTDYVTITPSKYDDPKRAARRKVVVFIVGGVTYQENRELQLMAQKQGFDAVIGSNVILNSEK